MTKYAIDWVTKDSAARNAIRKRFNIPTYTTLNGLSPAEIRDEDIELFRETARRNFFRIIEMDWHENGAQIIFTYRKNYLPLQRKSNQPNQ